MRRREDKWFTAMALAIFVGAVVIIAIGAFVIELHLRDASVKRCHDRGGQAITQEWWQGEDFWKVKCVQ